MTNIPDRVRELARSLPAADTADRDLLLVAAQRMEDMERALEDAHYELARRAA